MNSDLDHPPLGIDSPWSGTILAVVALTSIVALAYGSCVTGMVGYADDYWLLWQWREHPHSVLDIWNSAGRSINGVLFQWTWHNADNVSDLWQPRLAAIVGIGLLAFGLYATMRRMEYSWLVSLAMAGLTALLPTFGLYAAWATCSGHVYGCLAALAAFAVADVRWQDRPWWLAAVLTVAGIGAEVIALCTYQPAGMFYVVACMLALASDAMASWSWTASMRVAVHAVVLIAGMAAAFLIFKASAGEAQGIDLAQRAAMTTDLYHKAGRFLAQPLAQSCLPFWFTTRWSNAARAAVAVVVLGILVPSGTVAKLEGSLANRLLRTAGLMVLIPLTYLPHLIVAADFFPYRTRAAIAPAILFLLVMASAGGIRFLVRDPSRRRTFQQVALAAVACVALIAARHHLTRGFMVPSQIEWATVRTEVLRQAQREHAPQQVVFLMPDSNHPLTGRFVYDEFGYLSSSHEWTCRGMTGLAVVDVAPHALDAFQKAEFVVTKAGTPMPQPADAAWIIDARQLNALAPRREDLP